MFLVEGRSATVPSVTWRERSSCGRQFHAEKVLLRTVCTQPWGSRGALCQFLALMHCQVDETWMKCLTGITQKHTGNRTMLSAVEVWLWPLPKGKPFAFICILASGFPKQSLQPATSQPLSYDQVRLSQRLPPPHSGDFCHPGKKGDRRQLCQQKIESQLRTQFSTWSSTEQKELNESVFTMGPLRELF